MKKILILAVIAIFVMMPLASFAKNVISDSDLASITAQDSISIDVSGLKLRYVSNLKTVWDDADGFTGYTDPGYLGTTDITITNNIMSFGSGANGIVTLDVSYTNGVAVTRIETPQIIIGGTDGMIVNATMKSGTDNTLTGAQTFGSIHMGGVKVDIPPGVLTVTAHTSSYGSSRSFAQ